MSSETRHDLPFDHAGHPAKGFKYFSYGSNKAFKAYRAIYARVWAGQDMTGLEQC